MPQLSEPTERRGSRLRVELTRLLNEERDEIARIVLGSNAAGFSDGFWIFK